MCYILAYLIFVPIAKELAARLDNPSISTATALALGAVASFNLILPFACDNLSSRRTIG
jgi:gluconate:H+ symporter, GntP family